MSVPLNLGPLSDTASSRWRTGCHRALAGPFRSVHLRTIEAGQMAAGRKSRPDDAIGVDIHAARIETRRGHFEELRHAGFRRIVAALQPNQIAGIRFGNAPDGIIDRTRNDRVEAVTDPRILLRIERCRQLLSPPPRHAATTAAPRPGHARPAAGAAALEELLLVPQGAPGRQPCRLHTEGYRNRREAQSATAW